MLILGFTKAIYIRKKKNLQYCNISRGGHDTTLNNVRI